MPYIIKSSKDGFKVCKKSNTDECFSKEPLPLERTKKQRVAIIINENKQDYLNKAKEFAKKAGYEDWDELKLTDKPYKLELNNVKFGRDGYSDYVQNLLNNSPDAESKRKSYLSRATKIKGDWKSNKYSPNNLAIKILWGGGDNENTSEITGSDISSDAEGTGSENTDAEGTGSENTDAEGAARPFFGRRGGKSKLAKRLISMFPCDIETFVEPFVGAGNIFWRLEHKPDIKYVINDFDESVVKIFKALKNGDKCLEDCGAYITRKRFWDLFNKKNKTGCDEIDLMRNSFFGMQKTYLGNEKKKCKKYDKLRLEEAKEILKNVPILNQSFETVIKKYDDKTTFFYLDPPYENPKQWDYKDYVSPEQVYDVLKNIKGRFLLSYNDSSNIRNIFKEFNIKGITTVYAGYTQGQKRRTVNELIITNYTPSKDLQGGDLTQEITNAFLYGISYPIFNPSRENVFNFKPNALLPSPKDMLDMTIQSYKDPAQSVGQYQLVLDNPTYKFYTNGNVLIIAVRGTQEFRDVKAWLPVARGDVINTERVSTDLRDIETSLLNYKDMNVFGTGHSLAGVILDKLLDKKLILQSVSFNPAIEKSDLSNTNNLRYYLEQDPLFNIMGHFANNTIVLDRPQNIWVKLLKIITPSTTSINPATDHFIDKFKPHMPDNYPQELSGDGKKKYKMIEMFKGTGSVGKVFKKKFDVVSIDFDPKFEPDIETDILDWDYKKWYNETKFKPDFIWASPPCNTFSKLAYPLKERNIKTAEPYSARAKIGTKIAHKTIEIVKYFEKVNPNLVYIIENPKAMLRLDKEYKKLPFLNTTLYCLYNDTRYKPTDFWSNIDLQLKEPVFKNCYTKGEKMTLITEVPLCDRYKIPAELLKQMKKKVMSHLELSGGGIKLEADIASKGGEKVDETIQTKLEEIVTIPMDGGDIAHYYPKVRIIKYNDLDNYTSIEEILPSDDTYFILLYLDSPSTGHWVAMTRNKNLITFFDSYGGKIDSQLKWVDMGERIRLDTDKPCLTRLLKAGNVPYNYSPYDYQSSNPNIATCGSHCLNFITMTLDKGLNVKDYKLHMDRIRERTGLDYDEIVAMNFPMR
jgi:DNA adenine methylase